MKAIRHILSVLLVALLPVTALSAEDKPQHIIVIMSDDQGGWDYGFMGNSILDTPNIDAMAARGARLSRFYVSPVCTPTRASLMTGRYNYRTRAIDTYVGRASMDPSEITIAETLEKAGYATGIFGKWHLGDSYPMRPQEQGFQEVLVHRGGGIGQPSDPIGAEGKYTDPTLFHNGTEKKMTGYVTDIIFDNALDFIAKNVEQGKPSFTYIATNAPHGPYHDVPQGLLEKYQAMDLTPSMVTGKDNPAMIDRTARVYAMVENIDENVGKLFSKLKTIGAYENTLVIYLNDNGPNTMRYVGPHSKMKTNIEEGGIRSPLLAHWPKRLKAGLVNDRIAAHYDIFPTLLSAAGLPSPNHAIDGVNILPLLEGKAENWLERKIYLQWHRGAAARPYENGAVISQTYKLSFPRNGGDAQFYNLVEDPAEKHNLASEKPSLMADYLADYDRWLADVGSTRADNYAPPLIHIGNDKEPVTVLTRQDWTNLPDTGDGWGRDSIGNWPVLFEKAGAYKVRVFVKDPAAEAASTLNLTINDEKRTVTVEEGISEYIFDKVTIKQGKVTVAASLTKDGKARGVHQVHISRAAQ